MAQRPSFDMTKLTTADKILLVASGLLFIDSFFPWQRVCVGFGTIHVCASANAWSGSGGWAGILMAILALVLAIGVLLAVFGVAMPPNVPVSTVMMAVTAGTVLLGVIKFIIVLTNNSGWGAYIGIILIVAVAYGGYMKMQEPKALPPSTTTPPPAPGPTDYTT